MRNRPKKKEGFSGEESQSDKKSNEDNEQHDNIYIVNKIGQQIRSGRCVSYVVSLYRYSSMDNTAKPPHHILQLFIGAYWHRLDGQGGQKDITAVI